MKKILSLALATLAFTSAAHAEDSYLSFRASSVMTTVVTLCATGGFGHVCRVVEAAQDDLNYFVASKGQFRTAQVDEALRVVREAYNVQAETDYNLAVALISRQELK